jgi:hypothetical protein
MLDAGLRRLLLRPLQPRHTSERPEPVSSKPTPVDWYAGRWDHSEQWYARRADGGASAAASGQ